MSNGDIADSLFIDEDELDNDTVLMHKIDEILYGEHTQPFSTGDSLAMLVANCIQEAYKKGYIDGKLEGFDVAFDCHDYDRLRTYRAELAQLRSTPNDYI